MVPSLWFHAVADLPEEGGESMYGPGLWLSKWESKCDWLSATLRTSSCSCWMHRPSSCMQSLIHKSNSFMSWDPFGVFGVLGLMRVSSQCMSSRLLSPMMGTTVTDPVCSSASFSLARDWAKVLQRVRFSSSTLSLVEAGSGPEEASAWPLASSGSSTLSWDIPTSTEDMSTVVAAALEMTLLLSLSLSPPLVVARLAACWYLSCLMLFSNSCSLTICWSIFSDCSTLKKDSMRCTDCCRRVMSSVMEMTEASTLSGFSWTI
mmetsp:Transcript_39003/g.69839  ORF Transcript_39003/g.69839 Transcript_39003/m.69839 type:complete len:262 (+) Transcript_39003:292-1077(+)